MTEEIKKENLEKEVNEEVYEGDLNLVTPEEALLTNEEIEALTDEELYACVQRTENIVDRMELEVIEDEERWELYTALKKQEKVLYKKVKALNKEIKEKGFFDYVKPWMFIYTALVIVLGIFPVNPWLPLMLMLEMNNSGIEINETLMDVMYIVYVAILLLPGYITCIFYKRGTHERRLSQRALIILLVIATIITIPGIVLYFAWV